MLSRQNRPYRIVMLGGLRVEGGEHVITHFQTYKTGALLAWLAHALPQHTPREMLIEAFWPDASPERGRNNLSIALSSLRHLLEPPETPAGSALIADRYSVRLHSETLCTDVNEFEEALRSAERTEDPGQRVDAWERAVALYQGELLPGYYEEWIGPERQRLAEAYVHALRRLVRNALQHKDTGRALDYAHRAVAAEPLREELHRDLMTLYVASGQPSAALKQYRELEQRLREALSEAPSPATLQLRDQAHTALNRVRPDPSPAIAVMSPVPSEPPSRALSSLAAKSVPGDKRLPLPLTRFFGRQEEVERLNTLLGDPTARLITLTGPGGAGKTRLAIEATRAFAGRFEGRIVYVPLADLTVSSEVIGAIRNVLKLPEHPDSSPEEQIVEALMPGPSLLVLDNLEHLLLAQEGREEPESLCNLLLSLLDRIPSLMLLSTSRQPLGLSGEQEFPVAPLPTPKRPGTPERLLEFASVQLFVDRARLKQPDFQVTPRNAESIVSLCDRMDGIPLALELAASWVRALPPGALLARLQEGFDALVSRQSNVPERHQTLYAAIEWSYRLLTPAMQLFLTRLSVFRGGCTVEAAEAVCEEPHGLERLEELALHSLIALDTEVNPPRYRMLEMVRAFAQSKLTGNAQSEVQHRHTEWLIGLAEAVYAHPDKTEELERLASEEDNLRAAIQWELEAEGNGDAALRLLLPIYEIAFGNMTYTDRYQWLLRALRERLSADPKLRAQGLFLTGTREHHDGNLEATGRMFDAAARIFQKLEDRAGSARVLLAQGNLAESQGNPEETAERYQACERIAIEIGDVLLLASVLTRQGSLASKRGDLEAERNFMVQALALVRSTDNNLAIANACICLAENAIRRNDYAAARPLAEECLQRSRPGHAGLILWALAKQVEIAVHDMDLDTAVLLQSQWLELGSVMTGRAWLALGWAQMARIELKRGNRENAQAALQKAYPFLEGQTMFLKEVARVMGWLALESDRSEKAAWLLSFGEEPFEVAFYREEFEALKARTLRRLGKAIFDLAWASGKTLTEEDVLSRMKTILNHP